MPKTPKTLDRRTLATSRLFHIEGLTLRFANGVEREYERLTAARDSVLIVPLLDAGTLLLVREYAAGADRYELGLPRGSQEPGEDPSTAADRELKEELGYGARRLTSLRRLSLSPAYMAHQTTVVLAEDLYPMRLPADEPEPLEVIHWPLRRLNELVLLEDFSDARSIAAVLMVRELLGQRGGE